ncbi:MAG: replicative DNA helicase [Deltaproteobacteria bacterium]|nr:replicative DNA helicase [Candidatus Anaeroferrophillus wilburensis]MBN2888129.1 replicative DNA helicase [Deltaproteobacteria bacterium]
MVDDTGKNDFTPRVPPQNMMAEQAVLGGVMLDNLAINKIMDLIEPADFYRESNRKIYQVMIDLSLKGEAIDLVTVTERLKAKKMLEQVGGVTYLSMLVDSIPTAANILSYAKIIKEKSILRQMIGAATTIVGSCYGEVADVEELVDQAETIIFNVAEKKVNPAFSPIEAIVKDSFRAIERLYDSPDLIAGTPSGFTDLDKLTSGFQRSDLIIIAGRPSMGKTAFALNIAQNAAVIAGLPVAVFSLEMAKEQLVVRMLCSEAEVDAHKLRSGFLARSDWPKLTRAAGSLSEAPIFIDDSPAISVLEMRAKSRRLKAEHNLGLVIVDYLQLMRGHKGSESREREISEISRSLKALAKELDVPVIALSQLNRSLESRQDKRPQLSDLRESGAIEQDADVILFVYRDEVYDKDNTENKGVAEIIVGKQRNGPVGTVKMRFFHEFTAFKNMDQRFDDVMASEVDGADDFAYFDTVEE